MSEATEKGNGILRQIEEVSRGAGLKVGHAIGQAGKAAWEGAVSWSTAGTVTLHAFNAAATGAVSAGALVLSGVITTKAFVTAFIVVAAVELVRGIGWALGRNWGRPAVRMVWDATKGGYHTIADFLGSRWGELREWAARGNNSVPVAA